MPGGTGLPLPVGFVGLRCRVAQGEAHVSSDRFSFSLSTRTIVAVAVIFGLCIILNGIPACHKICKMFCFMCLYGVCFVSCAVVMRFLMCSLQYVFLVRQCNVHAFPDVFRYVCVCPVSGVWYGRSEIHISSRRPAVLTGFSWFLPCPGICWDSSSN